MPIAFYCPFYIYDRNNMLKCENQKKKFNDYQEKKEFIKKYCTCSNYKSCEHAKKLIYYYGGKNEKNKMEKKINNETQENKITTKEEHKTITKIISEEQ